MHVLDRVYRTSTRCIRMNEDLALTMIGYCSYCRGASKKYVIKGIFMTL